ncbi:C-GCAxxG-C-C family protein [Desulfovibrio litoralis]|uniref:C_GCAxxG_C_C family probable redox protein n=1 Tax=Desulfovibrio litoralis DSM 11393 TaxID=1121455 RepID=A0A1M7T472_9BACT|nr:C-GCAxxG-C-C family protein [Desulfovibrio litoralis]SHN65555.1 C_GCAxxG_C_C family probable redox protein [Desulfovibrio litoralis DSM 11393]
MPIIEIAEKVHRLYWDVDMNCARTTMSCLSELFDLKIDKQTMNAAIGLHGAGCFRAQCGLVEGALMFIGIYLSEKGKTDQEISQACYLFAKQFTDKFGSLRCFDLRPNGFTENDPPHACESLSVESIFNTYQFIRHLP